MRVHLEKIYRRKAVGQNCMKSKFLKTEIKLLTYPDQLEDGSIRIAMTKLKINDHKLNVERGRCNGIRREEKCFPVCDINGSTNI